VQGIESQIQLTLIFRFDTQDAHLQLNHAVEIIGKVQNDLSVRVMASTDLGPESGIGEFSFLPSND
jgi:hypothetical protein